MFETLTADCIDWIDARGESALLHNVSSITEPNGDITEPGLENTELECEELCAVGEVTDPVDAVEPGEVRHPIFDCTELGCENAPENDVTTTGNVIEVPMLFAEPGVDITTVFDVIVDPGGDVTEPRGDITENDCGDVADFDDNSEPVGDSTELPGDVTDPGDFSLGHFKMASAYGFNLSIS